MAGLCPVFINVYLRSSVVPSNPEPALTDFLAVLDCGRERERMMRSPSELSICGEHYEE